MGPCRYTNTKPSVQNQRIYEFQTDEDNAQVWDRQRSGRQGRNGSLWYMMKSETRRGKDDPAVLYEMHDYYKLVYRSSIFLYYKFLLLYLFIF